MFLQKGYVWICRSRRDMVPKRAYSVWAFCGERVCNYKEQGLCCLFDGSLIIVSIILIHIFIYASQCHVGLCFEYSFNI